MDKPNVEKGLMMERREIEGYIYINIYICIYR